MMTDKEFLDGIYQKARLLESGLANASTDMPLKVSKRKIDFYTRAKALMATAAMFLLIAVPTAVNATQPVMQIPDGYNNLTPVSEMGRRTMDLAPPQTGDKGLIEYSDVICSAKVIKIEKSVYEKENQRIITNVQIKPTNIIKGSPVQKTLTIQVNGGYDAESGFYKDYEAVFTRGEDVLVFLEKDIYSENSYILYGSTLGKYTYEDDYLDDKSYVDSDGLTVTISGLKKVIA